MEKTFGGLHLIYLGLAVVVMILSNIILKKKKVNE